MARVIVLLQHSPKAWKCCHNKASGMLFTTTALIRASYKFVNRIADSDLAHLVVQR
jgi:hypothetical protein